MRSIVFPLVVLALIAPVIEAQERSRSPFRFEGGQEAAASPFQPVFMREPGVTVEVVGLYHWTPAMIQDSMDVHDPGASLTSRTCAATLTGPLGFPEAIAVRSTDGDSALTVLVTVVEPQDSERVTVRPLAVDSSETNQAPWAPLLDALRVHGNLFQTALRSHIYARSVKLEPSIPPSLRLDSAELRSIYDLLDSYQAAEDAAIARQLLESSPNVYDRMAAVAMLSNFDDEDATWHALVGALLDPSDGVRVLADNVLRTFTNERARTVDWGPAVEDLRAVLDGSALFALPNVLDMLVSTGVGHDLAQPLLKGGGYAVAMYASTTHSWARGPAYRFLRTVSGMDSATPAEWQEWIAQL